MYAQQAKCIINVFTACILQLVTEESYTHTKYECNGEFYRNQLVISAVFLVCGVLCLNMFFIPCAVAACINAIKVCLVCYYTSSCIILPL